MLGFEVEFYRMVNGKEPAKEFLLNLDYKMRARVINTIALLQDNGNPSICLKVFSN